MKKPQASAFTIVELLIVIVVIGILAAIVVVAYSGVTRQAVESSMKIDLQNAVTALELEKAIQGSYPVNPDSINGGQGLKSSGDSILTYSGGGDRFCVSIANSNAAGPMRVRSSDQTIVDGTCDAVVTTLAGSTSGFQNGTGTAARFSYPMGIDVDSSGNLYVADRINDRIRKISPAGEVTTFAGSGTRGFLDGAGSVAQFSRPSDVAVDSSGNVYVADTYNHRIRKISPAGEVTTIAGSGEEGYLDGPGVTAQFDYPDGLALSPAGEVYVAGGDCVRKIALDNVVTTVAGACNTGAAVIDGVGLDARFAGPYGITFDNSGEIIYVSEYGSHIIRKITSGNVVSRLFSSGSQFNPPRYLKVSSSGDIYVADQQNHRVRKVTPAGVITTFAGTGIQGHLDGTVGEAQFNQPHGIAIDSSGNIYVSDSGNHRIRKITP